MIKVSNKYSIYFASFVLFGVLVVYFLPYIIYGENAHILIHDNLDSNVIWLKTLADNDLFFASNFFPVQQIMNGVPRLSFGTELNIISLLFEYCSPFYAILLNQFIIRIVAYCGMFVLLKKHIMKDVDFSNLQNLIILLGLSSCFALLPFWPSAGLSVAGQPFLLSAFLNIKKGNYSYKDYLFIVFFPFYSVLVLAGIFILLALGLLFCIDFLQRKSIQKQYLLAIGLLCIFYVVVDYRLFMMVLLPSDFVPHRVEFNLITAGATNPKLLPEWFKLLSSGHFHASINSKIILVTAFISVLLSLVLKKYKVDKTAYLLIASMLFISFFSALWLYNPIVEIHQKYVVFRAFRLERLFFILPIITYIFVAIAIKPYLNYKYVGWVFVIVLIFQLFYLYKTSYQYKNITKKDINNVNFVPTYAQFYDKELFDGIKKYINKPLSSYKVASVGLHPAVTQYNSFYTVDGYVSNYPLSYKHWFGSVIAKELTKNEDIKQYFIGFGSRCYIFSSELGIDLNYYKNNNKEIQHLDLDYQKMKEAGCLYLISAVKINTANNLAIQLEHIFESDNSCYRIFLYKIK
ncbi:hypothetical protein SAMN05421780_102221 [Flexibacter flexilis DSM 6793]|uniref:4-amino-4-deoxy-L-arabinose transferase n=1 Tax=Flexibacter flexilis DSM 6793 TaxID=927664 RepID=A0A1I1FJZ5_9BACT|nr:DUF6044 family protein [Flexibacter flexilis]SFB99665.1 hypothetical protein SAMN05421780_102221 [Flexibacter flexilis DSM 6793]